MPVLVLAPHARCNCRCLMCDIWKSTDEREMTASDLERHLEDIDRLSVNWVVLSGGEPLMHSDLFRLCQLLKKRNVRITLLSTGLLLERNARHIVDSITDVIVSLDGPAAIHDRIRRVPGAFAQLLRGVGAIRSHQCGYEISARCTVQNLNCGVLSETAYAAWEAGLKSISFLAADITSEAFNRPQGWTHERQRTVALSEEQIPALERQIEQLSTDWQGTGFVLESREKLLRIVRHFQAHLGLAEEAAPRCNAPWVSAVIETDGTVRPCFFQPAIGNVTSTSLLQVVNGREAVAFRASLDITTNPVCRRCVCSLNWQRT
jgi:MoaA/NifB/PqqE/SkfB family radical SAM enzyme